VQASGGFQEPKKKKKKKKKSKHPPPPRFSSSFTRKTVYVFLGGSRLIPAEGQRPKPSERRKDLFRPQAGPLPFARVSKPGGPKWCGPGH